MAKAKNRKLSLHEIECRSGISASTFIRYLNGQREIPLTSLQRLCTALDTTLLEVLTSAERILDDQNHEPIGSGREIVGKEKAVPTANETPTRRPAK